RVLEPLGLQKGTDCLRYGFLARNVELVLRADLVQRSVKMITEGCSNIVFDFFFTLSRPGQEDRRGNRLSPLDALRVIMRHFGTPFRLIQNLIQRAKSEPDRAYPHR